MNQIQDTKPKLGEAQHHHSPPKVRFTPLYDSSATAAGNTGRKGSNRRGEGKQP